MKLLKTGRIIRYTREKSRASIHSSCPPPFEECVQEPLNSVKWLPRVGREEAASHRLSPGFLSMSLICQKSIVERRNNSLKFPLFKRGAINSCCRYRFLLSCQGEKKLQPLPSVFQWSLSMLRYSDNLAVAENSSLPNFVQLELQQPFSHFN